MMKSKKTVGIICEYNPFHGGHRYQIEEMHRLGFDRVVCVMSGNTVQRGEFAIADKYTRAETAVKGGADLVLELPYPYSASSAEFFALAGVRILENAGVDAICFGSECGDMEKLKKAAEVCDSEIFFEAYKNNVSAGKGTAKAYFEAYKNIAGEELPGGANDILGISYLRALKKENSNIEPIALVRKGSDYRAGAVSENMNGYPSATMLRNYIHENGLDDKLSDLVPKETFETLLEAAHDGRAPVKMSNLDSAIIAHLRLLDASRLEGIADIGGGLGEKILSSSHKVTTYEELVSLVSDKHYTEARTRRAILNILTGVTLDDLKAYPAYTTVLGFNDNGRELLSELRKKEKMPFITKPADADHLGETAARQIYLDRRADALFTLATPKKTDSGEYVRKSPIYIYN